MSYCVNCGKQNPDTSKFCTGCGSVLGPVQPTASPKNNSGIILLSVALLLVVLVSAYFLFFNKKNKAGDKELTTTSADSAAVAIPAFSPTSSYDQPKELLFTGKREKEEFPNPMYPRFFPIGWSRDGKFAFVEEPVDESCGCYFFNLYIQDMYSDKMLWTWNTQLSEDQGYDSDKGNPYYFKQVWEKNNALFSQKLNAHGIEPLSFSSLEKLPLVVNNNQCSFKVSNQHFYSEDFGYNMLASSTISMWVNGVEKKKVFHEKYTRDIPDTDIKNFSTTLSDKILGYLKNPYENRIAIFYITETRGWEGPPNVISTRMIGCDLNNTGLY